MSCVRYREAISSCIEGSQKLTIFLFIAHISVRNTSSLESEADELASAWYGWPVEQLIWRMRAGFFV